MKIVLRVEKVAGFPLMKINLTQSREINLESNKRLNMRVENMK